MAISRIGASSVEAASITIPGTFQNGDLAVIFAYRVGSASTATVPAGWTAIGSGLSDGGTNSGVAGYRILVSASDTSGTWTNATGLVCMVYRGIATNKTPVAFPSSTYYGSSGFANTWYQTQALTSILLKEPQTSWVIGLAGAIGTTSVLQTAPTGMSNQTNTVGASAQYVGHDTNGVYASNGVWRATSVTLTGTTGRNTVTLEILAEQLGNINNYQQVKVGDGMSCGERIR